MSDKLSNIEQYQKADKSVLYHDDDPDLRPIRLSLPKSPPWFMIDGYGLSPEEQRFKRLEIPNRLKQLEQEAMEELEARRKKNKNYYFTKYKLQDAFWEKLESNPEKYSREIEFIKKVWWHRLHGYWFFNRGKPTYITGWHFMYLNFWHMPDVRPDGYPHYRDRDRREFIFHQYAYTTTETFAELDDQGWAIKGADGEYKMKDLGRRVCLGVFQQKHRRSGNTNKGLCMLHDVVSMTLGTDGGGIMSYTGSHAESQFKHKLVPAWNKMPLFLLPFTSSSRSPSSISYSIGSNEFNVKTLNTGVTYAETASSTFYDGKKLVFAFMDEEGKSTDVDVDERWMIVKNCLSQGSGAQIHGYSYHPSTVEEYTSGGKAYREMGSKSSFYQRIPGVGMTPSGLFRLFLPGDDGLDGYIDSYGLSVKGDVKQYQREEGFAEPSDKYLQKMKDYYLSLGTPEAMAEYRALRKQFPQHYAECWLGEAGDIGFNIELIDERMAELRRHPETIRGNFEWENGFGSKVVWIPNEESGRCEVSRLFEDRANLKIRNVIFDPIDMVEREAWAPYDPMRGTVGADTFTFKSSSQVKKSYSSQSLSDGGIVAHWGYDAKLDGDKKRSEWDSDLPVCTYRFRAKTDDDFCEDVLKIAIWYGFMVYPEANINIVHKKFREWGYDGYLKFDVSDDGRMKDYPGAKLGTQIKQEGFTSVRSFIEYRCHKVSHYQLLNEFKNITNQEELPEYDMLAAFICALLGEKSRYTQVLKRINADKIDITGLREALGY